MNRLQHLLQNSVHPAVALLLMVATCTLSPSAAPAQDLAETGLCAVDVAPAGTLLFPQIELDPDDPAGLKTVVTIANHSSKSVVAHVTMWSDFGIPLFDYDIYLTGWDVVTWDLLDTFHVGNLPRTAESVSPHGPWSDGPTSFGGCGVILPFENPALFPALLQRMQAGLTGDPSDWDDGLCLASPRAERVATGYITVDLVERCNLLFPSSDGYWQGTASNESLLVGSYRITDPASGRSVDLPAVHIEAEDVGFFQPGDRTWALQWIAEQSSPGLDRREPLPSRWAVRFESSGDTLHAWRSTERRRFEGVDCGTTPPDLPLPTEPTLVFDDEENPLEVQIDLPFEVNVVDLGPILPLVGPGWMVLDLRHSQGVEAVGDRAQSFVRVESGNLLARSYSEGWPLDDHCPEYTFEVWTRFFADGFESGGCGAWSVCPVP